MIVLKENTASPLYIQIYEQIKTEIMTGKLLEGDKLPSTRMLSKELNISRNTVETAYHQLLAEGYISSKACSGFIVEKLDSSLFPKLKVSQTANTKAPKIIESNTLGQIYKYDFKYGRPSVTDFPLRLWRKVSNQCLSLLTVQNMISYNDNIGELDLRLEVLKYINKSRGVNCTVEQIIMYPGIQLSLALLCQLFKNYSTDIALEDPGYIGARDVFTNNGFNITPVSIDHDGINLDELEASSAKIVYVTPSHQFPTGSVMHIQKRLKLLEWAKRTDGVIIEDDYDSEFRYNSKPIPSIQSIDTQERVIYIGSFSKSLAPSLRLSYIVLPRKWLEAYNSICKRYNTAVPWLQQKILQQFMSLGYWDRHLRKISLSYKRKHDLLISTIEELMKNKVIIHGKNAGLHILLEFKNGMCEEELISLAENHGVKVYPVSPYWIRADKYPKNMILIGFSGMSENDIVEGIKILYKAWFQ